MVVKACKRCRALFEGSKCPQCESTENADSFKGCVNILDPEQSEIAKNLNLKKRGLFAIRLR